MAGPTATMASMSIPGSCRNGLTGGQGYTTRLWVPCRALGTNLLHWQHAAADLSGRCACRRAWQLGWPALNGYKVVFVPFKDGHPDGMAQDFVTGFLNAKDEARRRPVGLAIDKSGALLIADDVGKKVWRVTAAAK